MSQHLARLRGDALVATRRESQTIYYSLDSDGAAKLLDALYQVFCAPGATRATRKTQTRRTK